jgi:hypothetical protein
MPDETPMPEDRLLPAQCAFTAGPLQSAVCLKPLTDRQKVCSAKCRGRVEPAGEGRVTVWAGASEKDHPSHTGGETCSDGLHR